MVEKLLAFTVPFTVAVVAAIAVAAFVVDVGATQGVVNVNWLPYAGPTLFIAYALT